MIFLAIPTAKTKKVRDFSVLSCLRVGYTASEIPEFVTTCYIYITCKL